MLVQMRSEIEHSFGQTPGGLAMMQTLFANVRTSLVHGLQLIFFWSAVIMTLAIVLHILLPGKATAHADGGT